MVDLTVSNTIANGLASVNRVMTCHGKPVEWYQPTIGAPFCAICGRYWYRADHTPVYKYVDNRRLGLLDKSGGWHELDAPLAYAYMEGRFDKRAVGNSLGVMDPDRIEGIGSA